MTTPQLFKPKKRLFALAMISFCCCDVSSTSAQGPGWSPVIIATGQYRHQIKSLPIEQRPNRPFHFYGNAVRRSYYHGSPASVATMSVGSYPTQSVPYSVSRPATIYHAAPVQTFSPDARTILSPIQSW